MEDGKPISVEPFSGALVSIATGMKCKAPFTALNDKGVTCFGLSFNHRSLKFR